MNLSRRSLIAALGACVCLPFTGCATGENTTSTGGSSSPGGGAWPRTITHPLGETTISKQPERIVSTSPVLTGTLLALNAPVIASGGSAPNAEGFDENGFFTHWSGLAKEKGVTVIYKNGELDLEAVIAQKPDLIIVAASGGDSQAESYAQLAGIAPTVSVDYNEVGWEEATNTLATVTGQEVTAAERLKEYDEKLAVLKESMTPPSDPVQAIVFTPGQGSAFAKVGGPHDKILKKLGITLDGTDLSSKDVGVGGNTRNDFAFLSEEATVSALTSENLLLVGGDESYVTKLKSNPSYTNIPAVKSGKVVALGLPSFKLDYYSALDMAQHVAEAYKK